MAENRNGCICPKECLTLTKPEAIPPSCPGRTGTSVMAKACQEYRRDGTIAREYWKAFARLVGHGGATRSRLEHIMEFANSAGWKRIGLAGCARYLELMHVARRVLVDFGFESYCVSCKVGGNKFTDIGIEKDSNWTLCNPLGQAMLLNDWGADLNVAFGLCMGHDLIFQHYSDAPVTTLVVKEKISDDNTSETLGRMARGDYKLAPFLPGLAGEDSTGEE